ncbi:MAG TPA: hydroxylamine reductase, partial [Mesoaciditoga lauensis]|nr:hydroxylamine reductase [Mesoaciditoga lauensis]
MFCYQCEETLNGKGCTKVGVCGKKDDVATLQDLLIYTLKGISFWAVRSRKLGLTDERADIAVIKGLFATVTNVNFDPSRFIEYLKEDLEIRDS